MATDFAMEEVSTGIKSHNDQGGEITEQDSKQSYWFKVIRISQRCLMVSSLVDCIIGVSLRSQYTFGLVVCYLAIWVGMLGLLVAAVTHIATYELENGQNESVFVNYAINSNVVSFLLVLFVGLAASIVSLRSIFEDYLQQHANEHDEYATDVGFSEIAVTALALSTFAAVAAETATLVAVSRVETALISSMGNTNSARRKAALWNRDQAYLSVLLVFGLMGTAVVGRATFGMYYVDGAISRKEVRVSSGIGIMLFTCAMAGLAGLKLRFCGYALAVIIPSAIAAASAPN